MIIDQWAESFGKGQGFFLLGEKNDVKFFKSFKEYIVSNRVHLENSYHVWKGEEHYVFTNYDEAQKFYGMVTSEDCYFCHRVGFTFYAGYVKKIKEDEFDEFEIEKLNYCPICGRKL